MSAFNSVNHSPYQSIDHSESNHTDHEMEDQKTPAQEIFGFENLGLTCYAGAALQCIQAI
jgi:ubiquitin C-terminal hydrolase